MATIIVRRGKDGKQGERGFSTRGPRGPIGNTGDKGDKGDTGDPRNAALQKWISSTDVTTRSKNIIVIGDSISEGTGSSTILNRWVSLLQGKLNRHYGYAKGADFPFIPAQYGTTAPNKPVTHTGAPVFGYGWGFGWRNASLRADADSAVFTFAGTSAAVLFTQNTTTGIMNIVVDGGPPIIVNTNGPTDNSAKYQLPPMASGVHTIVIKRDPSSAVGQYPFIQGMLTWNKDENTGYRVIEAAKHGVNSAQLTASNVVTFVDAVDNLSGLDLLIFAMGTNDYSSNVPLADYKANIQRQITAVRDRGYQCTIILLHLYQSGGRDSDVWDSYADQLAAIANANADVIFHDLRNNLPNIPSPHTDISGQGLYSDALHPSDTGHLRLAGAVFNYITDPR